MAFIQNGTKDSPPKSDHPSPNGSLKNGNKVNPPELNDDIVKVVVVGEPRCGKTSLIRAYWDHHLTGEMHSYNGVRVYPCIFEAHNVQRQAAIFEIPGDPDFYIEQRMPHYEKANVIVFMYAIDDPSSYHMISHKWLPETLDFILLNELPVVFVGAKQDLRNDQQVIERLALELEQPVTIPQGFQLLDEVPGHHTVLMECSANDLVEAEDVFIEIFDVVLMHE